MASVSFKEGRGQNKSTPSTDVRSARARYEVPVMAATNPHKPVTLNNKNLLPQLWRPKVRSQNVSKAVFFPKALGESLFIALPTFGGYLAFFDLSWVEAISLQSPPGTSLSPLLYVYSLSFSNLPPPSFIRTLIVGFRVHIDNSK